MGVPLAPVLPQDMHLAAIERNVQKTFFQATPARVAAVDEKATSIG